MSIEKIINGDEATLVVSGRLDMQMAPELEKELDSVLDSIKELTLDMSALEYVSSAGLRVILKAQKAMNAKGSMKLCNVNESIMDFLQVIEKRKSVRKSSYRPVERELLDAIVKVAQTAPSSRNSKSSAFMIVEDKDTLVALSQMRDYGSALISGAPAAIVVLGDETKTDLWVDNCAISATFVQLAVTAMDLVSCWVHCNGRPRLKAEPDGAKATDYVSELLGLKDGLNPYCVIAIGYPEEN